MRHPKRGYPFRWADNMLQGVCTAHHVLVVEDDDGFREIVLDFLRSRGCPAIGVEDGIGALEELRQRPPPCFILLDQNLPRLDGPGLLARLRANAATSTIPVISMSAAQCPMDRSYVYAHLAKPFAADSLNSLIARLCPGPVA